MMKPAGAQDALNLGAWLSAMPWTSGGAPGESFAPSTEALSRACQEWQREVIRFATTRVQLDTQHMQRLVACQGWADAAKLQQDWAVAAAQDYAREANQLVELAAKISAVAMAGKPPASSAAD